MTGLLPLNFGQTVSEELLSVLHLLHPFAFRQVPQAPFVWVVQTFHTSVLHGLLVTMKLDVAYYVCRSITHQFLTFYPMTIEPHTDK
jgi:hypothetical protein